MRKKNKLICGVGINDYTGSISEDGKPIKSYTCWYAMLQRCYNEKYQIKYPTYIGCSVCKDWLYFSNFKNWFEINHKEGFELDKDILIPKNKIYSPDTCRFVPRYINLLLTDRGRARGIYPLGVTYDKTCKPKPFIAGCNDGHGKKLREYFATVSEAVNFYSITKTIIVKQQADRALAAGDIGFDIHIALISRKF